MEGSVQTDEGGVPSTTTETAQPAEGTKTETTEDVKAGEGTQATETQTEETSDANGKAKLTEKGTKLDPDPLTAAHQELANERKLRGQYEMVLKSPELLRKFAKEAGYTLEEAKEALEEEVYSADKLQTGEDVAKALNEVRTTSVKEIRTTKELLTSLQKEVAELKAERQVGRVTSTLTSDVSAIREKYPVLNPKDPSYDPELEKEIGKMYRDLDYDEERGSFRGNISLLRLTDRIMRAANAGRKKGSEEAQTDIRVKERGKVVTSSKSSSGEGTESDDPGTAIAQRIAKSLKR